MIEIQADKRKKALSSVRGLAVKMLVAVILLGMGGSQHPLFIDGVTAATTPGPTPPSLEFSTDDSSPAIVKDTIRVAEGQTVTLFIQVYDPADIEHKYRDFSLKVLPENTPPGAKFAFDSLRSRGRYTWTAASGDAASYPNTLLTFEAENTFLTGKTTQTITLSMEEVQAPVFDASIATEQTVSVGEKLKLPLAVASNARKVKIKAKNLPKGAHLGPTRKIRSTGQWTAKLVWKPKSKHSGQTFTPTFTATAKERGGNARQTTMQIAFSVGESASTVSVTQAQWNPSTIQLSVAGTGTAGQKISLSFPDGTPITKVPITVQSGGDWSHQGKLEAANAPCAVVAKSGGAVSEKFAVQDAPANCVNAPNCQGGLQWFPESVTGMEGMCM